MDIYCPRCGEPMDAYELHDAGMSYEEARKTFFNGALGCGQLFNGRPCEPRNTEQGEKSALLVEMLGDDVDGIASMSIDF